MKNNSSKKTLNTNKNSNKNTNKNIKNNKGLAEAQNINALSLEKIEKIEKIEELEEMLNQQAIIDAKELIKHYDIILLIYILKTTSNYDLALSVTDVSEQLDDLIPYPQNMSRKKKSQKRNQKTITIEESDRFFPSRTLRRKFDAFSLLIDSDNKTLEHINTILPYVFGGNIAYRAADGITNGTYTKGTGKQKRFYFDPILSEGDMDLLYGTIRSSRFLSEEEKDYLSTRLRVLCPNYEVSEETILNNRYKTIFDQEPLPKKPVPSKKKSSPITSSTILKNIQTIHEAIQNKYQIEVVYGMYDKKDKSYGLEFNPKNEYKPYILNPYAMFWNDGEYYLLSTWANDDSTKTDSKNSASKNTDSIESANTTDKPIRPTHLRVDRIISVKIHTIKKSDGTLEEVKCKKIPSFLSKYYIKQDGKRVFDSIKYANTFPKMSIYHEENLITLKVECSNNSIQTLVDNFGDELSVQDNPNETVTVTIKDVQRESALTFFLGHIKQFTVLSPDDLRVEIKDKIKEALNRYK